MKAKQKNIPLDEYSKKWINYNGNVLIIKIDKKGTHARLQIDGMCCKQAEIVGFVEYSFKSSLKYFDSDFWLTKTSWTTKNELIYFDAKRTKKFNFNNDWDKIEDYANKHARNVGKILDSIKKEVEQVIGKKIDFDFNDISYGINWFEAYIPLIINKKSYLLTWENCD